MKASPCCSRGETPAHQSLRPASRWGRGGEIAGWLLPTATLALIPKCPACVAGYVALATGLGITLPTASFVRGSLIALCLVSLAFLAVRRIRRLNAARAAVSRR